MKIRKKKGDFEIKAELNLGPRTKLIFDRSDISRLTKRAILVLEAGKPVRIFLEIYPDRVKAKGKAVLTDKIDEVIKTIAGIKED